MPKSSLILGLTLVGGGVALTAATNGHFLFYGAILGGFAALGKAASSRRDGRPRPDDPRWHAATSRAQIVGIACSHCDQRFVSELEARRCASCGRLTHEDDCAASHRARCRPRKGSSPRSRKEQA